MREVNSPPWPRISQGKALDSQGSCRPTACSHQWLSFTQGFCHCWLTNKSSWTMLCLWSSPITKPSSLLHTAPPPHHCVPHRDSHCPWAFTLAYPLTSLPRFTQDRRAKVTALKSPSSICYVGMTPQLTAELEDVRQTTPKREKTKNRLERGVRIGLL